MRSSGQHDPVDRWIENEHDAIDVCIAQALRWRSRWLKAGLTTHGEALPPAPVAARALADAARDFMRDAVTKDVSEARHSFSLMLGAALMFATVYDQAAESTGKLGTPLTLVPTKENDR